MGALVSALLSSADSALLAPSSVIGWDLIRVLRPRVTERTCLLASRLSVVVLGVVALLLALHRTSVYDLMVDSWSVLLATLFVPLTAGIWWRGANAPGALAAILTGFAAWLLLLFTLPGWPADLLAVVPAVAALVVVSRLSRSSSPPAGLADDNGRAIAPRDRLGWLPREP